MKNLASKPYFLLGLYALAALIFFERGLFHLKQEGLRLEGEKVDLMRRKGAALKMQGELEHIIASQNDTEWLEQTLMRVLGLVPEGTLKIVLLDE